MDEPRSFSNCYEDRRRAVAYSTLAFSNTYALAYRDLKTLVLEHARGRRALDFGCGTGRSTRFLKSLGFTVTGIDIAEDMLQIARERDPEGDYRLTPGDDLSAFPPGSFDLVLVAFTFDNIPALSKARILRDLKGLLAEGGVLVNVVSSPEIYTHEWASFTTKAFPENRNASSGDLVRIIVTDHQDPRPVEDILSTDESYSELFRAVGFDVAQVLRPLARGDEPYPWVSETKIAPWVLYALKART